MLWAPARHLHVAMQLVVRRDFWWISATLHSSPKLPLKSSPALQLTKLVT
jgi:hypothetical protein